MILNSTRNTVISYKYKTCGFFMKAKGLMFSSPRTLVFEFRKEKNIPLHMLFVFFAIDVIYLDKNNKVVELKKGLRPFSFYTPNNKAKRVIEVQQGSIKESGTRAGDVIKFK